MKRSLFTVALVTLTGTAACSTLGFEPVGTADSQVAAVDEGQSESALPQPAPPSPPQPLAGETAALEVWRMAMAGSGERIIVSREHRHLWLIEGDDVRYSAPVAVGRDTIFRYGDRSFDFATPRGRHEVLGKETDPLWIPPDWHYLEKAVERGLEPVQLKEGDRIELSDGTRIEVRGRQVGRVNQYGNFWAFRPGMEMIFDDKIFIPPINSAQRRIPEVLGTHRLILGDGYLIHGTPEEHTIGSAASHGCVRMLNPDVERLYAMVEVGTPVYVY